MFGLTEHPLISLSLTIVIGVACTVATGAVVTYGFQYLVQDHNITQVRNQFKRQQRRFKDILKQIEEDCKLVKPQLDTIRQSMVKKTASASASPAGSPDFDECIKSIPSNANPIHTPVPATNDSSQSADKTPSPTLSTHSASSANGLSTPQRKPSLDSKERISAAGMDKKLKEVDEHLLRLLERLDSVQIGVLESFLSGQPRQKDTAAFGLFSSAKSESLCEIDTQTSEMMRTSMDGIRSRKRTLVSKVQELVAELDLLCSKAGLVAPSTRVV